jgi:hypothetical protein
LGNEGLLIFQDDKQVLEKDLGLALNEDIYNAFQGIFQASAVIMEPDLSQRTANIFK